MSAFEQDLDEYLAGDEPDYTADVEAPQDADEVDRRLRRLAKVRAEMAQIGEHAQAQIDRINEWHARRVEVLAGKERWLEEGLEMWHRAVLAEDPSRKTISLPCGTLKARVQQPVWEFDDETFIAWAEVHAPGLVRVPEPRPAVDRKAAKVALDDNVQDDETVVWCTVDEDTGEVLAGTVPGVTVTVRPPSFTVVTEQEVGE